MLTSKFNLIVMKDSKERDKATKHLFVRKNGRILNKNTIVITHELFEKFLTKKGKKWYKMLEEQNEILI
jgi:hypothetical protein